MALNIFEAARQISLQFCGLTDHEIVNVVRMALIQHDKEDLLTDPKKSLWKPVATPCRGNER